MNVQITLWLVYQDSDLSSLTGFGEFAGAFATQEKAEEFAERIRFYDPEGLGPNNPVVRKVTFPMCVAHEAIDLVLKGSPR